MGAEKRVTEDTRGAWIRGKRGEKKQENSGEDRRGGNRRGRG